mmetsp:Transcript_78312/g.207864  ORF Transcript_78312/g.207864 Transcript_78312/m.207864 type:complete len:215 (-) Transcript_78312:207-851(-)
MSLRMLSSMTQPDGLRRTTGSWAMECLDTGQHTKPRPPPESKVFWSRISNFTGIRSLTLSFFPDIGHLVAVSTLVSSVGAALGVVSLAQKLFSRCLALSTTSNSPSRKRFAGPSSSGAPGTRRSLRSSARLCRASEERRPWSAFWKSSISLSCSFRFSDSSCRSFFRSCSSYFFAFCWSSIFCVSKDSNINSRSKMKPSGVATGSFAGFSERQQ